MAQVKIDRDKDCSTCIKNDVCEFKNIRNNIFANINEVIMARAINQASPFDIFVNCRSYLAKNTNIPFAQGAEWRPGAEIDKK